MNAEEPRGKGRLGWIIVALVVVGSATGVGFWFFGANNTPPPIDASGFDLTTAPTPEAARPTPASGGPTSRAPSGLTMLKPEPGLHFGEGGPAKPGTPAAAKKETAHATFAQSARKHEGDVRGFAERMTAKYPVIDQYGRDWMKYPDLKKLNDDYMRNRDPIAFLVGLSRAPNLGTMLKAYAGKPEIREFVVQGMKQAPGELTASAMDVLQNDAAVKNIVSNVASNLGLPPSVTGLINSSGASPQKIDQNQVMKDVLSTPEMQKATQGR